MTWDKTVFEAQVSVDQKTIEADFNFIVGDEPVTISSLRSSCGCTTTALEKLKYEPGESGVIEVKFDLGSRVGRQKKYVFVELAAPEERVIELEMDVYIPHIVKMEPRFVYWTKGESYREQEIKLQIDADEDVSIKNVTSDQEQLQVIFESTGEKSYSVKLRPHVPEGELPFFRATIKIEAESELPLKQRLFYAYAFMKSA